MAVTEAGFVDKPHIKINSSLWFDLFTCHKGVPLLSSRHSTVAYRKRNFSRVENLYFFVSFDNSRIHFVDGLQ